MAAALGKHRACGSACRSCRTGLSMGKRRLGSLTAQRAVLVYEARSRKLRRAFTRLETCSKSS